MLTWSAKRRLLYFLGTVILILLVGFVAVSNYRPMASCFDGKQNQDERGVDCGGNCAQVCPTEIQPIKTLWTRLLAVGQDKYDAAALLENPNPAHLAAKIKYIVKVWDKNNLLINTRRGEAILNPLEQFVIFESRIDVGEREPDRVIFELTEPPVWQRVEKDKPQLDLERGAFVNDPTPRLVAKITNRSLSLVDNITVVAVLSGADENALAVSSTLVESLAPDESREVVFTWPTPLPEPPVFFDLYSQYDLRTIQ